MEEQNGKKVILSWLTRDPHGERGKLPEIFRLVMIFIDRIGFPIFVSICFMGGFFFMLNKILPLLEKLNSNLEIIARVLERR